MHLNPLSEILSPQYHPSIPDPFTFLGGLNILPVPSFESRHLYIQSQCQSSHRLEESTQAYLIMCYAAKGILSQTLVCFKVVICGK